MVPRNLRKFLKEEYDFVYYEKGGYLLYNGNGSERGWGNTDQGGLVAILEGSPELTSDDFIVLA